MRQYFITDGRGNSGPFTLNELARQNLTAETLVWHDMMTNTH